jgi:hypothetical protein
LSRLLLSVGLLLTVLQSSALGQEAPGPVSLVQKIKNPLADQVSIQLQPNFNFGVGPDRDTEYVFNLQPNIPINLPGDWVAISRTILPLVNEPGGDSGQGYTFGIGDIQQTFFFTPPSSETFIWGFGPVFQFPSASATTLGTGKWEIGPTVAAILNWGPWQLGAQINNLWSFAGDPSRDAVNQMFLQPQVNYTLPGAWYLIWGPQFTANWKAGAGDRWTVPVGAGFGKVFSLGQRALSVQAEGYYNAVHPSGGPTWSAILTIQLVFPR